MTKPAEHKQTTAELSHMELFIGNFLRYGVLFCAAIITLGIILTFLAPTHMQPPMQAFVSELLSGKLLSLPAAWTCGGTQAWSVCWQNPANIVSSGLVLLIALPILRVALTLAMFVQQRDWIYTGICGLVLAILLVGILLGSDLG